MRKQWRFPRSSGHRSKSQQKTNQNRDSKAHVSSRKRFNRNLRMVQEPAERLYFKSSCSLGAATTRNSPCQTQEAPIMFARNNAYSRQQREYPHCSTRTALQLNRRYDQKRTCLWQFAQVGQVFEMIQTRSQRHVMHREILRPAVVDAQRIAPNPAYLAPNQHLRA